MDPWYHIIMAITKWHDDRRKTQKIVADRIKTILLESQEFGHGIFLSDRDLHETLDIIEPIAHMSMAGLMGYLRIRLWGHKKPHKITHHKVPKTALDHIKLWFAGTLRKTKLPHLWLRDRVKWEKIPVVIEFNNICPHIDLPKPDRHHYMFISHEGEYSSVS